MGYRLLLCLGLMLVSCGQPPDVGQFTGRVDPIVGGEAFTGIPAIGALTIGGSFCTGTLVSPRKVVAAAHCMDAGLGVVHHFRIGPQRNEQEHSITVESIHLHPDYELEDKWWGTVIKHDVGYAILAADAPVAPLAVVREMDHSWVGRKVLAVGYGITSDESNVGLGTKRAVPVKIAEVNEDNFEYDDRGRGICNGDSGGPALYENEDGRFEIVGVASSVNGDSCNRGGTHMRVDVHLDFLDIPPLSVGCPNELATGRCVDSAVRWCDDGVERVEVCDHACAWDEVDNRHGCVSMEMDPCRGETWRGRCDGEIVAWCDGATVATYDCAKVGKRCGWFESAGFAWCM